MKMSDGNGYMNRDYIGITFRSFLEGEDDHLSNLSDIKAFVKKEYPAINVCGLSHSEIKDWVRQKGLVPKHGVTADVFNTRLNNFVRLNSDQRSAPK